MIYKIQFTSDQHLTMSTIQKVLGELGKVYLLESITEITETHPELQYKLEDFESQEEYNKYKEAVYFAKLGVKVTK